MWGASTLVWLFVAIPLLVGCSSNIDDETDILNDTSYEYHYRDLDSTLYYARKAEQMAYKYDGGRAEAYNNKAFVSIARMQYALAKEQLDSVANITDNQVELLIADIQQMRLCQRQSRNKEFYTFRESALQKFKRIGEDKSLLSDHHRRRMIYARSEFHIVTSTYYYYVGLEQPSVEALEQIDPNGEILQDTPQWLNYLYNVGAGGIITEGTQEEINQLEMEYLMRCYNTAVDQNFPFWIANSLQAMSEHLTVPHLRQRLIEDNFISFRNLNINNVPDSILSVDLAQRSLNMFSSYGDVYQKAGSYRTLAQCYRLMGDNEMTLKCLNEALHNDTAINQAPDLVASIWEQLSVIYAALNDKTNSHKYRNKYLDTQDQTRQDRYFESRAEQLSMSINQLNAMTYAIIALMLIGIALLFLFSYLRRRQSKNNPLQTLLLPLEKWKKENDDYVAKLNERYEEATEQKAVGLLHIENNKRLNLEQRAKISLVNTITPYIDRMLLEITKLKSAHESEDLRKERYEYLAELTDQIMEYNNILTRWIQLRKGDFNLHVESFPIQALFDIVAHGRRGFQMKDIQLEVDPSDLWVKADKILTLFMINTIADNARKYTPEGGTVKVYAKDKDDCVEVSISDNGIGMTEEQMAEAFSVEKKAFADDSVGDIGQTKTVSQKEGSHGFGLVNCKGIIEKYKKTSSIFKVCDIGVESKKGEGSRFFFRLPKGVVRTLMTVLCFVVCPSLKANSYAMDMQKKAEAFTDSVWSCNTADRFAEALLYGEAALKCLNKSYLALHPNGKDTLVVESSKSVLQAEILWFHEQLPINFDVILLLRNEIAVAALSLHQWSIYNYNNKVYTQLYKEMSADSTLPDYCSVMQKSQANKYMAIVILVILSLLILLAYFTLYYRHLVYFRFCLERVRAMNDVLQADIANEEKLSEIENLAGANSHKVQGRGRRQSLYDDEKLPEQLQHIADELIVTLKKNIASNQKRLVDIDIAEDEVRKCQFENDKIYVCNSVLDNCLSTLKHETMYYPSRIRTLLESGDEELQSISELADYYKELYTLLSIQAMRQVESIKQECVPIRLDDVLPGNVDMHAHDCLVLGDRLMLKYLFEILWKQSGGESPRCSIQDRDERYLAIRVAYPNLKLDEKECLHLFDPTLNNIPFLMCRQIVRDVGESTNARGCGVIAEKNNHGTVDVVVTLPKAKKVTIHN